ncbi:MAG: hypothetical protein AVDCRST_MAG73-1472, partial [uncultured Thermomicrobiales bacterium]
ERTRSSPKCRLSRPSLQHRRTTRSPRPRSTAAGYSVKPCIPLVDPDRQL